MEVENGSSHHGLCSKTHCHYGVSRITQNSLPLVGSTVVVRRIAPLSRSFPNITGDHRPDCYEQNRRRKRKIHDRSACPQSEEAGPIVRPSAKNLNEVAGVVNCRRNIYPSLRQGQHTINPLYLFYFNVFYLCCFDATPPRSSTEKGQYIHNYKICSTADSAVSPILWS